MLLRMFAAYVNVAMATEIIAPAGAYALTSGPSQPEFSGTSPVGVTDMVDLSSGSFQKQFPLFDVEGWPITLSYQGGYNMESEATYLGLGWMMNFGQMNRGVNGLPDEFKGDPVTREFYMKPNQTIGIGPSIGLELAGFDATKLIKKFGNYSACPL